MIRKALKSDISIEEGDWMKFDHFYKLMKDIYQSKELKIKSKEYYSKILKEYIPQKEAVILLAREKSAYTAGAILLRNTHFCHYWLGAKMEGAGNLGQGELLQWEAIKWAKKAGSRYYDLCVVEPERLPNIAKFKLGFSKEIVPFYCVSKKKLGYQIISRFQKWF